MGQRPAAHEGHRGVRPRHPLAARHRLRALPQRQLARPRGAAQPALRFVAGSSPGGGGERACEEKAPHSQQDGHVCHRFCGQILLPIRPCYQSCYGVQIRSAPSGVGHPSAGTGGTVGCHRRHLQSHAGQAQRDRCGLWVNHGLHAVQCGGVFLAVTPQCPCSLCTVESLRAAMKRKPLVV